MTKIDGRRIDERQQRFHRRQVVLTMNHVRRRTEGVQAVHDGNGRAPHLLADLAGPRAIRDRGMTATEQF